MNILHIYSVTKEIIHMVNILSNVVKNHDLALAYKSICLLLKAYILPEWGGQSKSLGATRTKCRMRLESTEK